VVLARAVVALAAMSLLAGCSGRDGGSPTPSASPSVSEVQALRAVSTCMRAHGYPNFPDPVQSAGVWGWPDTPGLPDRTTNTPCDNLVRRAKSMARGKDEERVTAAGLAKLRRYSACIRQHGVADWPDPTTRGDFVLPQRLQPPQGETVLKAPDEACAPQLGGLDVRIVSAGSKGNK
jgi:hypothetical protein